MQCPRCGHENLPGSRFCAQCGNRLEKVCPVCSVAGPPDARFCTNCGNSFEGDAHSGVGAPASHVPPDMLTKITEARSARTMQGERRTVTMLFADIQGSTAAAEGLDPEDWTEIMNGAFEHLIAPVYRYEGTLARLLGDAVLAFFGAPIAHEDDPVRAVRAGLDIIEGVKAYNDGVFEQWGIPINVRVGINTGLVVVGEVGSDLRVEYTALGDAVNVAARMEQTAEPGTVRVTGETWTLVSDHFVGEEIGPVEVKGKSEPVEAVRVLRVCAPADDASADAPLVGRSAELDSLLGLRERLLGGAGWVASILGEAGVGKSRLLDELRREIVSAQPTATSVAQPGELTWMTAFSESYDASIPYSTIRDLFERWWALGDSDDPYRTVDELASELLPDLDDAAAFLGYIAGVPLPDPITGFLDQLEPPVLHGRARQTVTAYIEAEAARRPTMVTLEDLHWADPMSLTMVEDIVQLTDRVPIGVVFSMRPYRDEAAWHVHEVAQRDLPHRHHPIELTTLEEEATEYLLDSLLDGIEVPDELRRRILERSDGNPLFIGQMAQAIRDGIGEGEDLPVPTGLASLLTARLDRLAPESRMVTQVASVIGSEFDRPTLSALVGNEPDLGERINELLRRQIFVERPHSPGVLAFHHALMQEAAYSTMLLRTRRELHSRVASHLESSRPDGVEEIARHFHEAGDVEAAFPYLVAAGEKTARAMALSESIRFFTTALDNIAPTADPELVVRAHDGLGTAYSLVPDLTRTEATYQKLVDYADTIGRPSDKVKALNRLALNTATISGDLETARGYLDQAYAIATEVGDEYGLAEYHMNSCAVAGLGGDLWSSALHDEETIKSGQSLGAESIRLAGMYRLAESTAWLLDFERAIPAADRAMEAAREAGDEAAIAHLEAAVFSVFRLRDGDTRGAVALMEANEKTLQRYGDFEGPIMQWWQGVLSFEVGDLEAGISGVAEVLREAEAQGAPMYVSMAAATLAHIYASIGIGDRHPGLRAQALEALRQPLGDYQASTVWADLGDANLVSGRTAEAEDDFRTGREVSSVTQYWERPRLLVGRARALSRLGQNDRAHPCIDEAETFVLEKGVRFFDCDIALARGEVLLAEGRNEEAAEKFAAARLSAEETGRRTPRVEILAGSARAALAMGDQATAAAHVAETREAVAEIAAAVVDADLRRSLESSWLSPLDDIMVG